MEKGNKQENNSEPILMEDSSTKLKHLSSIEKSSTVCTETSKDLGNCDVLVEKEAGNENHFLVKSSPSLMLASHELLQAVQAKYSRFGGKGAAKNFNCRHMSIS